MGEFCDTIKKAIDQSGQSRYEISKATGIHQTVLFRIYHGGSCSIQTAETLCEYLGWELAPKKRKGR